MKKVCCIIPTSNSLICSSNSEIINVIVRISKDFGINSFIIGTNLGVEQNILEQLIILRNKGNSFTVTGVIATEDAATDWTEIERDRFFSLVSRCDYELLLHPIDGKLSEFYTNIVMIDIADIVFLVGRDENLEYWVKKREKPLLKFDLENKELIPNITLLD